MKLWQARLWRGAMLIRQIRERFWTWPLPRLDRGGANGRLVAGGSECGDNADLF